MLTATDPTGVITGLCFGSASISEQHLAETSFFAVRAQPNNERLISVGSICCWGPYIADKGFEGAENHRRRWQESYGASVIHPPKRNARKRSWSKRLRRWVAGIRQKIVESV